MVTKLKSYVFYLICIFVMLSMRAVLADGLSPDLFLWDQDLTLMEKDNTGCTVKFINKGEFITTGMLTAEVQHFGRQEGAGALAEAKEYKFQFKSFPFIDKGRHGNLIDDSAQEMPPCVALACVSLFMQEPDLEGEGNIDEKREAFLDRGAETWIQKTKMHVGFDIVGTHSKAPAQGKPPNKYKGRGDIPP